MLCWRTLLAACAALGWPDAPTRRLLFAADIPKLDKALPRALAPNVDAALMAAVANLDDPFARAGLQVLRGTGLRVGELLDLEVNAVIDYKSWSNCVAEDVVRGRNHGAKSRPLEKYGRC